MKEFVLDLHQSDCDTDFSREWCCRLSPERFLFFLGNEFRIVTYNKCCGGLDFKMDIIKAVLKKVKIFDKYDVGRGIDVAKDLRDFRIRNQALRKYIRQANFIYKNAAHREFAITTTANYIEAICDQETILSNYNVAKEYLIKHEYNWLLKDLDNLFGCNYLFDNSSEVEHFKTIEHLTKSIQKLTK